MEMSLIYPWINFFLFVAILYYFLRTPLRDFLGDRAEGVRQEIDKVGRLRLEAETHFKMVRRRMAEAETTIEVLRKELRSEGELEKRKVIEKARKFAEKIREEANRAVGQELNRAKYDLKRQAILVAIQKAKKVVQTTIQPGDQVRLFQWGMESFRKEERDERKGSR